ncbi:hypothetical protein [Hymenobacter sublimis]|uniref:Uncharacterized protein n=1 Tax=Hymenobacter sublimis TaxID=2933777 RepID=A0ABY4JDK4_9BACT|nr:hypothetical protein [Hymenobacter sublimis]UPL50918.1 hypothetical protein MWH26_08440 [Hymenobacter sublimis]
MEISSPVRFKDQNKILRHFKERIAVCCPKCGKRAEVFTNFTSYHSHFHCPNCFHQSDKRLVFFELVLKEYCKQCANRIMVEMPEVRHKKEAIKVRCSDCGCEESYKPTYIEHVGYSYSFNGVDPFFQLPLWYQASFKDELLWAYGPEHLLYLEQYIGARLRERNQRRYTTMVECLPQFIKAAKNRDVLLKLLERMKLK